MKQCSHSITGPSVWSHVAVPQDPDSLSGTVEQQCLIGSIAMGSDRLPLRHQTVLWLIIKHSIWKPMMMMADSLQMRILGRLVVSSCMLVGDCRVWFLMHRPYCTLDRQRFGLKMIGMLHAFFCLLRLSFVASCLFASNLWLASLTDEHQLSQSEASCCHDWWLILAYASCLSLDTASESQWNLGNSFP